jgi:hypothetical protein
MLQTPTRARTHSSSQQEDVYFTPTSAHISRFQFHHRHQRGDQRIIPLVLPSVNRARTISSKIVSGNVQRSEKETRQKLAIPEKTGFEIWQDTDDDNEQGHGNHENRSLLHPPAYDEGERPASASALQSRWNSPSLKSKSRMGKRSITFPGTEKGETVVQRVMDSPVRRRFNSGRSDMSDDVRTDLIRPGWRIQVFPYAESDS